MKKGIKYIITVIAGLSGIFALNAGYAAFRTDMPLPPEQVMPDDTVAKPRIPVKKTIPEEYEDLNRSSTSDLRDPENLKTEIEYDIRSNAYLMRSRVGDMDLGVPLRMSPEEYQKYTLEQSLKRYFYERNRAAFDSLAGPGGQAAKRFDLMDMQFDIGGADKLFGPGGVRLRSQGTLGINMGLKTSKTNNPSLPEKSRSRTFFDFNTDVQMTMRASVGTKIGFDMNYNTEATFDVDAAKLKLAYQGEEDEIVKSLEGGNVSMTTNNSLIHGGAALFGVKTDLQFGKLRVRALVAQQESDSRSISSKGGSQMTEFEIPIDKYDENRHYFLAHYFRDTYDRAMSKLPYISSAVAINRVEVWVTNKSSNYGQARNIVAFADLGEQEHISNPQFTPAGNDRIPYNEANTLYRTIVNNYPGARDISAVTQTLNGFLEGGRDYEKIESARLLSSAEYTLNPQLGYISLNASMQMDEVLAVAFEYTYNGTVYQVGEFSSDNNENASKCLFLKTLKGTSMSPSMPVWNLMMKNIYYLNGNSIQKQKFRLDVVYQSDTAGAYVYTIPEGNIKGRTLLKVMNLDRLNSNNEVVRSGDGEAGGDGFFDFVEGYTIHSSNGRVIFPVVEPFGSHLRAKIGNDDIADKYVYQELYDSTLTIARQIAEKNKFLLRGQYAGSSSNVMRVGATNVARGSVIVRANGIILTENVDYIVNYASGTVTILNENLLSSNANIQVSLENQSSFNTQRKTMLGADLNYEFSKNFNVGTTIMHLSEMPLTTKTTFGEESVKNTLWGVNMDYKGQSQWITNMFDKLPLLSLTQPSTYSINAEFAHLIAGHYQNKYTGEYSYLDDFESTQSEFELHNPYFWNFASVPYDDNRATAMFPEAGLTNNVDYGKNRALLAWYYIDGLFTRRNSSLRPSYMSDDDLSNHHVRAVQMRELFPNRDQLYNENNYLNVLNLAYYPNERGPYNLDADNVNSDGTLMNPEKRWGGIMRNLDQTDFEAANIQYIEFWVMDPFINNPNHKGGDLYFNLGEISEDILKDEKKFFENGLPVNGDASQVDTTVWGKVPKQQSTVYAFDNSAGARALQDVGLNGISSAEERSGAFPAYSEYLTRLRSKLTPEMILQMESDPFSPLNDPGSDNYHYFRGSDYDAQRADILTRYKRYNGVEGNSRESGDSPEAYDTSSKLDPDAEDFNRDNTLNENEKYFQYHVSVRPEDMVVGTNHIVDKRVANVGLPNGTREDVAWYQFKIPIREYANKVGTINDFSSIRFMRTFMTGFSETTILRFGKFALVRGEWRPYQQPLYKPGTMPATTGSLSVSTVNIEENGNREPIRYTLPPGVTRITDPSQPHLRQQNEQSLSLKVTDLASQDARAVYKTTSYDLRRYKKIQLFVHAEKLDDITDLQNDDLTVFIRLGTDYKNNYYEYEAPLTLTPFGSMSAGEVWPEANILNIRTDSLTALKLSRNREKSNVGSGVTYNTVYSRNDAVNGRNTMSIIGNPSLSDVQVIMIGVRNNSKEVRSAEIWVNELRVTDFDESGGWAANTNMNLNISDFATVSASGNIETAGFGGLEQSVTERSMEDYRQFSLSTTVQLGKLFPEKTHVSLPLYYAYSKEVIAPQYNPLDQDVLLKESIRNEATKAGKDSIRSFSNNVLTTKAFALNNVSFNIRSKTPMPYDPANFSMGYASNVETRTNPETAYETTKNWQGNLGYAYTPYVKPLKPFEKIETKKNIRYLKQFAVNWLPASLSVQNSMTRNYYEIQLRDLNDLNNASGIPVSFSQNFLWDRAFDIRWNILSNLTFNLTSSTNARIEEPYVQVNRALNPDQYQVWKDSVKKSIAEMGTPLLYDQSFSANYMLPTQHIPALDWVTGQVGYKTTYNWEKGSYVDDETTMGNAIRNERATTFTTGWNLLSLYNKNAFLKKVIQKSMVNRNATPQKPAARPKRRVLKMEVTLSPDSGVIVQHNMLTDKVIINARLATDSTKRYKVSYKTLDYARVRITNRDTVSLRLSIVPAPSRDETFAYKLAEYSARTVMMIRRFDVTFSLTDGMYLPGFMPGIGNWFGQGVTAAGRAPGWGFAFGDVRRSYIDEAAEKGWFINNQDNITPAMIKASKRLNGTAVLEPLPGLKINLSADYLDSRDTEIQYMYKGMPETKSGNFSMTTIGLRGFLSGSGDAGKGYQSDAFRRMLDNRKVIAERINGSYAGRRYPDAGFLAGTSYPRLEEGFNPAYGTAGLNSGDVLIPSFLAAYTNRKPSKVGLTAFPSVTSLLPNWNVTYEGLIQIPAIRRHFRTVTLNHVYSGVYSIGSYTSYLNWVNAGISGDLGYVKNTETGAPVPSMGYEIASVTLAESFSPLLGISATFLNNVTAGSKYSKTRTINLNVTSYQLVETFADDLTVSLGYKYAEFNKILKLRKKGDFSNDLTVTLNYTYRKNLSLIRKLEDGYTQATLGSISQMLQFSADYAFSQKVTLRAFYDLQINEPLVSSSSFPTSNSSYGVSIQISLNQ